MRTAGFIDQLLVDLQHAIRRTDQEACFLCDLPDTACTLILTGFAPAARKHPLPGDRFIGQQKPAVTDDDPPAGRAGLGPFPEIVFTNDLYDPYSFRNAVICSTMLGFQEISDGSFLHGNSAQSPQNCT